MINKLFFPSLSPTAARLAAFATFAVGFLSRPLGGVIIAHMGDRCGRKPALIFALTLMGASTLARAVPRLRAPVRGLDVYLQEPR